MNKNELNLGGKKQFGIEVFHQNYWEKISWIWKTKKSLFHYTPTKTYGAMGALHHTGVLQSLTLSHTPTAEINSDKYAVLSRIT